MIDACTKIYSTLLRGLLVIAIIGGGGKLGIKEQARQAAMALKKGGPVIPKIPIN